MFQIQTMYPTWLSIVSVIPQTFKCASCLCFLTKEHPCKPVSLFLGLFYMKGLVYNHTPLKTLSNMVCLRHLRQRDLPSHLPACFQDLLSPHCGDSDIFALLKLQMLRGSLYWRCCKRAKEVNAPREGEATSCWPSNV